MGADIIGKLEGRSIGWALHESAAAYGDTLFLIDQEYSHSFAEFDRMVDRLAAGLVGIGIGRGDHVGLWLPNGVTWATAFFACARIGAAIIPINTRYKAEEAAYVIGQAECKAIIITPPLWNIDYYAMLCDLAPELSAQVPGHLQLKRLPDLRHVLFTGAVAPAGTCALDHLPADEREFAKLRAAEVEVQSGDLLLICYTSGTTGAPKGAMHSHRVLKQATKVGMAQHMEPGDVVLGHMPFYHVAGLFMALLPAMTLGTSLVVMQEWRAPVAMDLIKRYGVTIIGGIPTHFHDLMTEVATGRHEMPGIKSAWIGGSSVPPETYNRIKSVLGIAKLLGTYGMTENTISTTFNRWDDPNEIMSANKAPILAACEVQIVDPETGGVLPTGTNGEIWCRGETVMLGYFKKPAETRETITEDGWLRTGDIGHFDSSGYLTVTGRIKEMFKVGGSNAYPAEIEQHLARHPDIMMSAVVGVPDRRLGEVAFAFVVLRDGSAVSTTDILAHCKGQIADYKIPRYIRFVSDFPRTPSGKVKKMELVELAYVDIAATLNSQRS